MGRTVVGDEKQLEAQMDFIFRAGCSVQVGLLVGKTGSCGSRDLVFALVPTPAKDGEDTATLGSGGPKGQSQGTARKASKGRPGADSAPMNVLTDWVGAHARQVSKMLLGGMQVVGVYAFCSEGTFKSSLPTLWQTVMAVAMSAPPSLDGGEASEYLLHVSSSPRRLSCRSCSKGSSFSTTAFHPCEWKFGNLLSNLQEFSCTYTVDIRYPIWMDNSEEETKDLRVDLSSAIASEAARLQAAYAVVDGSLVQPEILLSSGSGGHVAELLVPFDGGAHFQPTRVGAKIVGNVVCKGEVHSRAYGVVREPVSRAIADLKGDIVSSLKARLELLVAEAEQAVDDANLKKGNENKDSVQEPRSDTLLISYLSAYFPDNNFVMPRRVFVPWLEGILISDYMFPNETFEDVQERMMDLFGFVQKLDPSRIIEPELVGTVPAKVISRFETRKDEEQKGSESLEMVKYPAAIWNSTVFFTFLGAALVLLMAALLPILIGHRESPCNPCLSK